MDTWLAHDLAGPDAVRVAVARRLARELDAPDLAGHAVPRIANALLGVVSTIADAHEAEQAKPSRAELRQLLEDVQ